MYLAMIASHLSLMVRLVWIHIRVESRIFWVSKDFADCSSLSHCCLADVSFKVAVVPSVAVTIMSTATGHVVVPSKCP